MNTIWTYVAYTFGICPYHVTYQRQLRPILYLFTLLHYHLQILSRGLVSRV